MTRSTHENHAWSWHSFTKYLGSIGIGHDVFLNSFTRTQQDKFIGAFTMALREGCFLSAAHDKLALGSTGHLIAMAVCQCDTKQISQCSMPRATPEATGCRHRATTRSVSPQRPSGQQANKQQSTNAPTKLAVLMATAMRRYNTAHITQQRRSRASLEATGCNHQASNCYDSHQSDMPTPVFLMFFIVKSSKKATKHKDSPE